VSDYIKIPKKEFQEISTIIKILAYMINGSVFKVHYINTIEESLQAVSLWCKTKLKQQGGKHATK